jgi:hypothetical protein
MNVVEWSLSRSICDDQVQKMCLKGRSFVEMSLSAGDSDRRFRGQAPSKRIRGIVRIRGRKSGFSPLFPFVCSLNFCQDTHACAFPRSCIHIQPLLCSRSLSRVAWLPYRRVRERGEEQQRTSSLALASSRCNNFFKLGVSQDT